MTQTTEFPVSALSVRQPWAWAIIYAGKDIENRGHVAIWKGDMKPKRIAIHASKGMTDKTVTFSVGRPVTYEHAPSLRYAGNIVHIQKKEFGSDICVVEQPNGLLRHDRASWLRPLRYARAPLRVVKSENST